MDKRMNISRFVLVLSALSLIFILSLSSINAANPKEEDPARLWWKTARKHVEEKLIEQDRDIMEIESPKWFETGYSTLGRMPLIDTCLREPLNMPEVTLYFDALSKENADSVAKLYSIADEMSNQADWHAWSKPIDKLPLLKELHELRLIERAIGSKLPDELKRVVIDLSIAVAQSSHLRDKAFAKFTKEERKELTTLLPAFFVDKKGDLEIVRGYTCNNDTPVKIYFLLQKVDYNALLIAGHILSTAVDDAIKKLKDLKQREKFPKNAPGILFQSDTSFGKIAIGGTGDDTYKEDYALLIDLGGNDTYLNHAAATAPDGLGAAVLIDVSGNDTYKSEGFAQSSAMCGVTALVDLAGDDIYISKHYSQCAALCGFSFFYEGGGDDSYIGDLGVQCFAIFGYSVFTERSGRDAYRCAANGQAGASTLGVALLVEGGGDDSYRAGGKYGFYEAWDSSTAQGGASGMRPWPPTNRQTLYGGIALLSEVSGNDNYNAYNICQGSSYMFSLGMLVDSAGSDSYCSKNYGRGTGCHLSAGSFIDKAGNDIYKGGWAHDGLSLDRSAGSFLDLAGDDIYSGCGSQGNSLKPKGFAIFVDAVGNDIYATWRDHFGCPAPQYNDNSACAAFFYDFGGKDKYPNEKFTNDKTWTQDVYGVGEDLEINERHKVKTITKWWAPEKTIHNRFAPWYFPPYKNYDALNSPLTLVRFAAQGNVLSDKNLNIGDITGAVCNQGNPITTRGIIDLVQTMLLRSIITKENALQFLPLLKSTDRDANLLGVNIIRATACDNTVVLDEISRLVQSSPYYAVRSMACLAIGASKNEAYLPLLYSALQEGNWRVRRRAALGLTFMASKKSVEKIIEALETDKSFPVRGAAAQALGAIKSPESIPALRKALHDENEFVICMAARALIIGFDQKAPVGNMINLTRWKNAVMRTDFVVDFLKRYTGMSFGTDASAWRKWWADNFRTFDAKQYRLVHDEVVKAYYLARGNNHKEALPIFRKIHKDLPGHKEAAKMLSESLNSLAWELIVAGRDKAKALKFAEEAVAVDENHATLDTLSVAYFLNGMKDKAIATIEKAIQMASGYTKNTYKQRLAEFKSGKVSLK